MIRVKTKDGKRFTGRDAVEVVQQMARAAILGAVEPSRYMRQTAKRVRVWTGETFAFEDETEFLKQLEAQGLITSEVF